MVQIPLWPDLALTSEKSEVTEWVFIGVDVDGRQWFVDYKDPQHIRVDAKSFVIPHEE